MFLYKIFLVYYQVLKLISRIHCEKIYVPQNSLFQVVDDFTPYLGTASREMCHWRPEQSKQRTCSICCIFVNEVNAH